MSLAKNQTGTRLKRIRLHAHFYVAGMLLLVGIIGFNFWLERTDRLMTAGESVPLKEPLSTIPKELGKWVMTQDIKLGKEIETIAQVDDYMNRLYRRTDLDASDKGLQVYVAYWGGIWVAAPHTPAICMRGGGWEIASARRREMILPGLSETQKIGVNVYIFSKDYDQQMIVWWDYIHGKNVTNPLWERIRWVLPVFMGGKAGSIVQVQISRDIPRGQSEEAAYQTIIEFAEKLTPEVAKCLPEAK